MDELACTKKRSHIAESAQRNVKKASDNRCQVTKTRAYLNFLFIFVTPLRLYRTSHDRKSIASRIFAFHRFLRFCEERETAHNPQMKTSTRRDKKSRGREKQRKRERKEKVQGFRNEKKNINIT